MGESLEEVDCGYDVLDVRGWGSVCLVSSVLYAWI